MVEVVSGNQQDRDQIVIYEHVVAMHRGLAQGGSSLVQVSLLIEGPSKRERNIRIEHGTTGWPGHFSRI